MPQEQLAVESLTFDEWVVEVDRTITKEISVSYPRAWREDSITDRWLLAVTGRFRHVIIADLDTAFTVKWDAFKATSKVENDLGDIGVIVRFNFTIDGNRTSVTGVGFMEAKRLDVKSLSYSHVRWDQLARESSNLTAHRTLLYDFEHIESAELNLQGHGFCRHFDDAPYRDTNAVVAITDHVLAAKSRSRGINMLGVPLGYQLCARYLRGLDLDYALDPAAALANIPGGPQFLIVADVSQAGETLVVSGEPMMRPPGYLPLSDKVVTAPPAAINVIKAPPPPESSAEELIKSSRIQLPKITQGDVSRCDVDDEEQNLLMK